MRHKGTLIALAAGLLWGCTVALERNRNADAGSGAPVVEAVERTGGAGSGAGGDRDCAAARHRVLIGRPIADIDTTALPSPLRVYSEGSRITMDHRPERLNLVVGPDGHVVKVRCG